MAAIPYGWIVLKKKKKGCSGKDLQKGEVYDEVFVF